MKRLFLSWLFLIFFIISCGSPSKCECKKEFEIITNHHSYLGSSLLDECMEVYKNGSFLNAYCDNAVSSDSEKTFLSEYKDIARFVLIDEYAGKNDVKMVAFGNYNKSSALFPNVFYAMDDCFDCREGWKIYVNELKCEDKKLFCKIIINKPNVFVEKCQICDSDDNTNIVFQTEYSISGDILTEKTTYESLDGKVYMAEESRFRRDYTIRCCTKREIKKWEKKNIIPID